MKRLLIVLLSVMLMSNSYAFSDSSGLKVNISGSVHNTYYICINNSGCYNISEIKGKTLPILIDGNVETIFLADTRNERLYPQKVPTACKKDDVENNEVLTLSGSISSGKNPVLENLRCSVN